MHRYNRRIELANKDIAKHNASVYNDFMDGKIEEDVAKARHKPLKHKCTGK